MTTATQTTLNAANFVSLAHDSWGDAIGATLREAQR